MNGCCDGCKGACSQDGDLQHLCDGAWDAQIAHDFDFAITLFDAAAACGCSVAMNELGIMYDGEALQETVQKCYSESIETYDASASRNEEYRYEQVPDMPCVDEEKMFACFRRAAMSGYLLGIENYASHLLCGHIAVMRPYPFIDVDKRFKNNSELYCAEEAVMLLGLLEKGCANPGYIRTLLGQAYDYGWGIKQNYVKAREYYTKGATLGCSWGMTEIGVLTFLGWGGTADPAKAFGWFRRAMCEGDARGALYAAYCYETGQGTSQDAAAAANLYRQVTGCNNETLAKRARDGLVRLGVLDKEKKTE